MQQLFRLSF